MEYSRGERNEATKDQHMDGILAMVCGFEREMRARTLTPSERTGVKLRLLDAVACAVGGSFAPPVEMACSSMLKLGGPGPCTVFAHGTAAVDRATLLNGFMIRYLDCNDTYHGVRNNCHSSDVISAALAVGEAEHCSGEQVMKAIAIGYHVFAAFSDAAAHRGWDLGFIGAAVAAEVGMLLGLSEGQLANAISLATVSQCALRQTRTGAISEWKGIAAADAAAHAVLVTYLAAGGMTGPDLPFEGKWGALAQFSGPISVVLDPTRNRTNDTETKLYPVGNHGLGPVELALDLRPRLGDFPPGEAAPVVKAVKEIVIRTYDDAMEKMGDTPDKWAPTTHETADHSIPFLFALGLCYGYVNADAIDRGLDDPSVLALTAKVRMIEDPEMNRRYRPGLASESASTADGTAIKPTHVRIVGTAGTIEGALEAPLGNVRRPVPPERISKKFYEFADPVMGRERAAKFERRVLDFENLKDVAGFFDV
jgi:2-methylcitrate dehydratase